MRHLNIFPWKSSLWPLLFYPVEGRKGRESHTHEPCPCTKRWFHPLKMWAKLCSVMQPEHCPPPQWENRMPVVRVVKASEQRHLKCWSSDPTSLQSQVLHLIWLPVVHTTFIARFIKWVLGMKMRSTERLFTDLNVSMILMLNHIEG